jgi:hypothetical protein
MISLLTQWKVLVPAKHDAAWSEIVEKLRMAASASY